ncbi:hypothetical protein HUZ36_16055 [Pseudoalteromonas sp. McH1-7]|uniref:hypothetical protein n=1 Tax=Pseudoalteromonas sp. McH1-7 TaxID=2745574 RepID=UPI00158FA8BB|nr:hypothetical protein [Pseudoalteromonas sp. McH1-7]NUZ12297.1 hypothetical protein [Pseudoalteromonas sp. McH1-7]
MNAAMLQVTECPDDVRLLSRMATVSKSGVVLGASIECDLILPHAEQETQQHDIYARIEQEADSGQLRLYTEVEGVRLNGRPQITHSSSLLSDGDIIVVFGYTLLLSMQSEFSAGSLTTEPKEEAFFDVIDEVEFDASNIFADLETELEQINTQTEQAEQAPFIEYQREHSNAVESESSVNNAAIEQKLDKLLEASRSPWQQQKQMLLMLDQVMDEFLKEFDPQLIEEMVGPPSRWSGKHWTAYKHYYTRKMNEGHFKRQFKALLIECMQK